MDSKRLEILLLARKRIDEEDERFICFAIRSASGILGDRTLGKLMRREVEASINYRSTIEVWADINGSGAVVYSTGHLCRLAWLDKMIADYCECYVYDAHEDYIQFYCSNSSIGHWSDQLDLKELKAHGFTHIKANGQLWSYNNFGLLNSIGSIPCPAV